MAPRRVRPGRRQIAAPTLVVTGTADEVVDPRNSELLAERHSGRAARALRGRRPPLLLAGAGPLRLAARGVSRDDHPRPLDPRPRAADAGPRGDRLPGPRGHLRRARGALRRARPRALARRPDRDADREHARARRALLGLREGGRDPARRSPGGSRRTRSPTSSTTPSRRSSSSRTSSPSWPRRRSTSRRCGPAASPTRPARRPRAPEPDDPLLLIYTSGTTGKPKGALLTHANSFWTNLGFDLVAGLGDEDVVLQVLPQFHCGGWNVQPLLAWWKGAKVVLERSFDAARCLALIEEKRVTTMMGVPAIYQFMAEEPGFADADLSSLRRAIVGGAPMPVPLLETWRGRGVEIVQGYGLTEAAPNVLCLPPEEAVRKAGYAGKPYPYVEVSLSGRGRAARPRPERLPRLLAEPGGDRGGGARRMAAHRRHRRARRRGLLPDPRPAEGHGHLRRRERVPGRGRGGARRAPGRGRGGGRRRAGRALGRGLRGVRRPPLRGRARTSCSSSRGSASPGSRCRSRSTSSTRCRGTRSARCRSPSSKVTA